MGHWPRVTPTKINIIWSLYLSDSGTFIQRHSQLRMASLELPVTPLEAIRISIHGRKGSLGSDECLQAVDI